MLVRSAEGKKGGEGGWGGGERASTPLLSSCSGQCPDHPPSSRNHLLHYLRRARRFAAASLCRLTFKLARVLPGTVVFFDKFCPDLHSADAGGLGGTGPSEEEGGESADGTPPPPPPPPRPLAVAPSTAMAAACGWCSAKLGNALVVVLSEDGDDDEADDRVGDDDHGGSAAAAGRTTPPPERREGQAGAGARDGGAGGREGGAMPPRVLGLREFLRDFFVGGGAEEQEELVRRGDLLRGVHLSNKVGACG